MLLLAILLWFLVVTEKVFEETLTIPIVVSGIPAGTIPATALPTEATVRFHGRAKELMRLRFVNTPHVQVNFSSLYRGQVVRLKPESVIIPGGSNVTVIDIIQPDSIFTELAEYQATNVPIDLEFEATFSPGYTLHGKPEISPSQCVVSGPVNAVSKIKSIHSEPVTLKDLNRTTEIKTKLIQPPGYNLTIDPLEVLAVLRVERIGERELVDVSVNIKSQPAHGIAIIEPMNVKTLFKGSVSTLATLESNKIKAWVDCAEITDESQDWLTVHVEVPEGAELSSIIPSRLRVTIRK